MRWHYRLFSAMFIVALICHAGLAEAGTQRAEEDGSQVLSVSLSDCSDCHEDLVADFVDNPHALLEGTGLVKGMAAELSCAGCHGDPTAHVDDGGSVETVFSFAAATSLARTEQCMACHGDEHPFFEATRHSMAGVSCESCHSIHGTDGGGNSDWALLKSGGESDPVSELKGVSAVCGDCHGDVVAEFAFNERHRLQEGILDCASCHDPHEPPTRMASLGGFKDQACVSCHTDKEGPFVFEHAAQRVEGCTACHTPHGSPNRHMLTFQRVAEVCYSCHGEVPGFHARFTLDTNCTNCHATTHGSNFDSAFLK